MLAVTPRQLGPGDSVDVANKELNPWLLEAYILCDNRDAIMESCCIAHKSFCWFVKVGLHIMQHLLLNTYLIYKKKFNGQCIHFSNFQLLAAKYLIKSTGQGRKCVPHLPLDQNIAPKVPHHSLEAHVPSKIPLRSNSPRVSKHCNFCGYRDRHCN